MDARSLSADLSCRETGRRRARRERQNKGSCAPDNSEFSTARFSRRADLCDSYREKHLCGWQIYGTHMRGSRYKSIIRIHAELVVLCSTTRDRRHEAAINKEKKGRGREEEKHRTTWRMGVNPSIVIYLHRSLDGEISLRKMRNCLRPTAERRRIWERRHRHSPQRWRRPGKWFFPPHFARRRFSSVLPLLIPADETRRDVVCPVPLFTGFVSLNLEQTQYMYTWGRISFVAICLWEISTAVNVDEKCKV